ncbi:hypothetical protein FVR03_13020 [Pontibacter qinzhouensis]|uniref:DUF7033 domain-containing protein n=1 Tax=Pontibacter qinzhouensis TaxID=2603253 RepID=A0A5C8K2N3_9BACT|nr:polysaccharide deacetylase family protein [Pontibacter qinzhouensis]TXK44872.1 hypothetical protein FVR03_13020 [Pontibacter qinzhouensis]
MLEYVLSHFYSLYPQAKRYKISYGNAAGETGVVIKKYAGNFFEGQEPQPGQPVWYEWKGKRIPFFFEHDQVAELVKYKDGVAYIQYDIVAAAFYLLSGWQEFHSQHHDQFGRFPYSASVQSKYGFIGIPVVNYYFSILKEAIENCFDVKLKQKQWKDSAFATCLTHDIDRLQSAWKVAGMQRLKQGRHLAVARLCTKKLLKKDAWNNIPEVMALAEKHQLKATYFWMAQNQTYKGHPNADYKVQEPLYQKTLQTLAEAGHEVALHGSFGTCESTDQLLEEAERLQVPVSGNRFHYLQYKPKITPTIVQQSQLAYDSTLGFAEQTGFRNSFCHPFFPYDFKNRKAFDFLELPLIAMDVTLYGPNYMHLRPAEVLQLLRPILREVKEFGGLFTLLWHNENISDYPEYPLGPHEQNWREVLEDLLDYVADAGTGFLTCSEAVAAFKAKE